MLPQNALQYHEKHCHGPAKKEVDIMSIATSELVGGGGFPTSDYPATPPGSAPAPPPGRPFVCPYPGCTKSYAAKNYLVQHERLHTGERPYKCNNCLKEFSRVLDMKKHKLLQVCR